jgi:hypothetical protein
MSGCQLQQSLATLDRRPSFKKFESNPGEVSNLISKGLSMSMASLPRVSVAQSY